MSAVTSSRRVRTSASVLDTSSGGAPLSTASSKSVTAIPNIFSNRRVSSLGMTSSFPGSKALHPFLTSRILPLYRLT